MSLYEFGPFQLDAERLLLLDRDAPIPLGPKVVAYNELARKKKSMEDRYNILRTKLSTNQMSFNMDRNFDSSNIRPLDPALVPSTPVSPSLRKNVAAGGVIITVAENTTVLNVTADALGLTHCVWPAANYIEAAGLVLSLRAGIDWRACRRPLAALHRLADRN